MIKEKLHQEMEAAGLRFKTFKVEHLEEIRHTFEELVEKGLLDKAFFRNNLENFNYDVKSLLPTAKSVIVTAAPQGKSIAEFQCEGSSYQAVIPPTYVYPVVISKLADIMNKVLVQEGYSLAKPALPLKLLAVKSGLGQYGRNNICYVPGFGSFHRLGVYVTDYLFEEDSWGEMESLTSCSNCTACIDNCPTGAIDSGRFLIYAQNCITNFNEYDSPMPEWVQPDWHDSLIGCMKCQEVCPHNQNRLNVIDERISFDEEETAMILNGRSFDSLPYETKGKITASGMEGYYHVLPRNLRLLMR